MVRVDPIDFGQRFGDGVPFKAQSCLLLLYVHADYSLPPAYSRPVTRGSSVLADLIRFLAGWQKAPKPGKMASAHTA